MDPLPEGVFNRLIKLSGMLTSAFEGERANAAAMASALLRQHGLTWEELLRGRTQPPPPSPPPPPPRPSHSTSRRRDWRVAVAECLERSAGLNTWETDFLTNLRHWTRPLSPKQRAKLRAICDSLEVQPPP